MTLRIIPDLEGAVAEAGKALDGEWARATGEIVREVITDKNLNTFIY